MTRMEKLGIELARLEAKMERMAKRVRALAAKAAKR